MTPPLALGRAVTLPPTGPLGPSSAPPPSFYLRGIIKQK